MGPAKNAPTAKGHKEIVRFLIKRGAGLDTASTIGTAAEMAAEHSPDPTLADYLQRKAHCGNAGCEGKGVYPCAGCEVVMYCSKECAEANWRHGGHRKECAELKQQRDEAQESRPVATPCGRCGKAGAVLKCGKCKAVHYCNRECQVGHWNLHKQHCGNK